MKMIFIVGLILSKVIFRDVKEKVLRPEDLVKHGVFFIDFPQYRLKLYNVLYNKHGIKFRKGFCYYSASIENKDSYGSFNVCDGIKGVVVVNGTVVEYKSEGDPYEIVSKEVVVKNESNGSTKDDILEEGKKLESMSDNKHEDKKLESMNDNKHQSINDTIKEDIHEGKKHESMNDNGISNEKHEERNEDKKELPIIKVENNHVVIKIDDNIKVKKIELTKVSKTNKLKNEQEKDINNKQSSVNNIDKDSMKSLSDLRENLSNVSSSIQTKDNISSSPHFKDNVPSTIKDTPVFVKIFFINDKDRVEDLKGRVDFDTQEIFEEASKIIEGKFKGRFKVVLQYMGCLNIVEGSFYEDFYRSNLNFIPIEKLMSNDLKIEKLEYLSDFFKKREDDLLKKSNLVVLLTSRDLDDVEGLSYIGGSSSKRDGFSTINVTEKDSVFYKGKVLAHEILHSLGAQHSSMRDSLMNESFSPILREKEVEIDVTEVEEFISGNLGNFKRVDTCGSGYLDGSKECDSSLLNGSECCTRDCRLRKDKECDDRNGGCCKGCKFVERDSVCGNPTGNYFFKECQRQGRCSGRSVECKPVLLEDGRGCLESGVCQKGVCQTPSLWCSRVSRRYEKGCEDSTRLMCLDEKDVCGVVLDSQYKPFLLK